MPPKKLTAAQLKAKAEAAAAVKQWEDSRLKCFQKLTDVDIDAAHKSVVQAYTPAVAADAQCVDHGTAKSEASDAPMQSSS